MKFLEKDLEEIIFNSDHEHLIDRGLYIPKILKRQLRIGNYGIADLVGFQRPYYHSGYDEICKGEINVIELKKDKISVSSFFQALNYVKGIQRYIEKYRPDMSDHYNYRITIIGNDLDKKSSVVYLNDFFNTELCEQKIYDNVLTSVNLYTYSYEIDGLKFKYVEDYTLINEGF